jgi:hypothetical protein
MIPSIQTIQTQFLSRYDGKPRKEVENNGLGLGARSRLSDRRKSRLKGLIYNSHYTQSKQLKSKQTLNKYFLYMQDWEFTDAFNDSRYVLLTSTTLPKKIHSATVPPLSVPRQNDLTNSTLEEINTFVRSHEPAFQECNLMTSLWLVIDQQGLEDLTCILVQQDSGEDEETLQFRMLDSFKAVRLPCAEVWSVLANLHIANMGFEDFADEDGGLGEDGTFKCVDTAFIHGGEIKERDEALKALRKLGHV